jgi:hypothetical protein
MNAAEILEVARNAHVRIYVDGDGLVVAAPLAPPTDLLAAMVEHKADLMALLRGVEWSQDDWLAFYRERVAILKRDGRLPLAEADALAFQHCVVEWLNRKPVASGAGTCLVCGNGDGGHDVVLPFGVNPGGKAWLHSKCWGQWSKDRLAQAEAALAHMGISAPGR